MLHVEKNGRRYVCDGCGLEENGCGAIPNDWIDAHSRFNFSQGLKPNIQSSFEVYGHFCTMQCFLDAINEAFGTLIKGCDGTSN
jgi:hypothetical protein